MFDGCPSFIQTIIINNLYVYLFMAGTCVLEHIKYRELQLALVSLPTVLEQKSHTNC
mgnify:CR=1 FL=1